MYVLSNWTIVQVTTPSGQAVMRLFGEISGHPGFEAGTEITISALSSYQIIDDAFAVITRSGTAYVLGKPNATEPDAMARVFQYLQDISGARTTSNPSDPSDMDGASDGATMRVK